MTSRESKVYAIVWGQCTSSLQAVLVKGNGDFEGKHKNCDDLWLFGQVKIVSSGIDNKSNKYKNLHATLMQLVTMRQGGGLRQMTSSFPGSSLMYRQSSYQVVINT